MKKIRKILKLKYENGLSVREIAALTGVSKTVVSSYLAAFSRSGVTYEESKNQSDSDLQEVFSSST